MSLATFDRSMKKASISRPTSDSSSKFTLFIGWMADDDNSVTSLQGIVLQSRGVVQFTSTVVVVSLTWANCEILNNSDRNNALRSTRFRSWVRSFRYNDTTRCPISVPEPNHYTLNLSSNQYRSISTGSPFPWSISICTLWEQLERLWQRSRTTGWRTL